VAAGRQDGSILLYELASGREVKAVPRATEAHMIRFHPNGSQLAISSAHSTAVQVLELETGRVLQTFNHPRGVYGIAWHPDGRLLAAACQDFRVYVWNAESARLQAVLVGHQSEPVRVTFSHSGNLLASSGWDQSTRLWDPWNGRQLISIPDPFVPHFSADDKLLAFCPDHSKVRLREVATGRECRSHYEPKPPGKGPAHVDISPDGRLMVSCGDDGVRLWDLAAGKEIARPIHVKTASGIVSVVFHPAEGSLIVSGQGGVQFWPIKAGPGAGDLTIGPPQRLALPGGVGYGRASLDRSGGVLAAAAPHRDQAVVFDLRSQSQKTLLQVQRDPSDIAISPDGKWVATRSYGRAGVRVWDAQTGRAVGNLPVDSRARLAFSPDGQWLVTADFAHIRLWKTESWELRHGFAQSQSLSAPAFTRDGKMLAVGISHTAVRLINPATGREFATLEAPDPEPLSCLCFTPDGSRLVAACETHVIKVWDLRLIRQQLAEMDLDWDLPPYPEAPPVTRELIQAKVVGVKR